jgi:site-specific DNA recombinase
MKLKEKANQPVTADVQFVPHLVGDRFFTVPRFTDTLDEVQMDARLVQHEPQLTNHEGEKMIRYAAYIRISSEEQVGNFSVDAQRRAIEAWVKVHDGKLTKLYVDEAQSGRTSDRPEFLKMRRDAKYGKFDAIVVHKFDRFARNRTDALAIKSLLRHEYGIKVFSVSEPSEDSDGAIGALIEGIMESVADWYSRNLAHEVIKGKRERAMQGYHNNQAPFGMDKNEEAILIPNEHELIGLKLAFELYSSGQYSDNKIARHLNEQGYVSKS